MPLLKVILKNAGMILPPKEFLEKKLMHILNTSNRRKTIVKNKTNIKISVDFSAAVPANTLCYVVLFVKRNLIMISFMKKLLKSFKL